MFTRRGIRARFFLTLSALALSCWASFAAAPNDIEALKLQAKQFEQQFDWDRACDLYEEILRLNRNLPDVRERYRHCLRRANQVHRHQDPTYRKDVLGLKYELALKLYETVFVSLLDSSLEKDKLNAGRLFRKGLEELLFALSDPFFCQEHLRGKTPEDTLAFRGQLKQMGSEPTSLTRAEALELVRDIATKARQQLKLSATTVVMEFTCGACHAVDDYTMYLSPGQLRVLSDSLKGEVAGVGIRVEVRDGRSFIAEVLPGSPASEAMVHLNDEIISVDKKPVADLPAEAVQELIDGAVGTTVELFLSSAAMDVMRSVTLKRRPVFVPSVSFQLNTGAVGYLKISTFQDSTVQELDNALLELAKVDVKALILDLRGNSGGLMDAAIEVAERFLSKGMIIVSTQHYDPKYNTTYRVRNEQAFALPMVVLVDGDTASAAEVLAGALKDNNRARLVGQTTFGKGCSQEVVRLPSQGLLKVPPELGGVQTGAIRITVARFLSPGRQPYSGRGVVPHRLVERQTLPESLGDNQIEEARSEAQRLIDPLR